MSSAYFSNRCNALVETRRDTFAGCWLRFGHRGPHEAPPPPISTTSDRDQAAKVCAKCGREGTRGYRVNRDGATVCTKANVCRRRQRNPRTASELRVSDADYAARLAAQGGGCALCGTKPKNRRLDVDHDHATGAVRGLLCHRCNRALPTWVDAEWLAAACGYLGGPLP